MQAVEHDLHGAGRIPLHPIASRQRRKLPAGRTLPIRAVAGGAVEGVELAAILGMKRQRERGSEEDGS